MDVDGYCGSDLGYQVLGEAQLGLLDVSIQDSDSFLVVMEPLISSRGQRLTAEGPIPPICEEVVRSFIFSYPCHVTYSSPPRASNQRWRHGIVVRILSVRASPKKPVLPVRNMDWS